MAKFLPFVVEKSTPIHIFQTLVSRSKGMNDVLVASIFYLVLEQGINEVRAAASSLPEGDIGSLYEKLLTKYPSYRVSTTDYEKIQHLTELLTTSCEFPENVHADLREHTVEDILAFCLVMMLHDAKTLSEYTTMDLNVLFDGRAEEVYQNIQTTGLFANDKPQVSFKSFNELKAYIMYHWFITPGTDDEPGPVTAVYGKLPAGAHSWKPKPKEAKPVPGARKKPSFGKKRAEPYYDGETIPPIPKPSPPSEKEEWNGNMDKLPWEAD